MKEEIILPHGPWTHISTIKYKYYNVIIYKNHQGFICTIIVSEQKKVIGVKIMKPLIVLSGDIIKFLGELSKQGIESTLISRSEPGFFFMFLLVSVGPRYIEIPSFDRLSKKELKELEKSDIFKKVDEKIIKIFEEVYEECENIARQVNINSVNYNVILESFDSEKLNTDEYLKKLIEDPTFIDFILYGIEKPKSEKKERRIPVSAIKSGFNFPKKYIEGELLPIGFSKRDEPIIFELENFKKGINLLVGENTSLLEKVLIEDLVGIGYSPIVFGFSKDIFSLFNERDKNSEEFVKLSKLELNILGVPNVINFDPMFKRGLPLVFNIKNLHVETILELLGISISTYKFVLRDAILWIQERLELINSFDKFIETILYYLELKGWTKKLGASRILEIKRLLETIKLSYISEIFSFGKSSFEPFYNVINIIDLTSDELSKIEKTAFVLATLESLIDTDRTDLAIFINIDNLVFVDDYLKNKFEKILETLKNKQKIIFLSCKTDSNISMFLNKLITNKIYLIKENEAAIKKDGKAIRFFIRPTITGTTIPSDDLIKSLSYRIGGIYVERR